MRRALIGHTGFVGSNLRSQSGFSDVYNSTNFQDLAGQEFDEIVCSGISAVKWQANKEPEKDWAGINALLDVLDRTKARRFVLISTIDVYPDPSLSLDENAELDGLPNHAYGKHRLAIENWVRTRFPSLIVRLPALFGPGLKKNAIFDLLENNQIEKINPAGSFQWYPLERLTRDIETATIEGLTLVNLFTEPVSMQRIINDMFPDADGKVATPAGPAPRYNLGTRYAHLLGGQGRFIMDAEQVLARMRSFVDDHRRSTGRR